MRPQDLIGHDVFDPEGQRIGQVGTVYLDSATHEPGWVTVRTGWFGQRESFVPLTGAHPADNGIQVDVRRDLVKGAPRAEGSPLSAAAAAELYRYYGLPEAPPPIPLQRTPKPSDMPARRSPATP